MLRGYRSIILAIGLALASPSYSQESKGDQANSERDAASQLDRIASAIEKQPVAPTPDSGCQPGQDDRQSDLCAQWKAADAAAESARWTYWTFIASFFGLLVGGGTLFAAWRAAHWAKKAAEETRRTADLAESSALDSKIALEAAIKSGKAAEKQVKISKDTARHQLRAYVTVEQPRINHHPHEGLIVEYSIVATNDGVTPAISLQWVSRIVLAFDEEAEAEFELPWKDAAKSSAIVGAGKPISMIGKLPSPITAEYQRRLEDGTARIWAIGEIRYLDIFGDKRSTRYRGYYDFLRGFVWDTTGNEAT